MKSDFVGIGEADLISSEAVRRRFHPNEVRISSCVARFHFTFPLALSTDLCYNEAKKGGVLMARLQAHRGVSFEYPENTIVAYQAAVDQGYAIIELDPKYTLDNKFVMLHDHSLKRTARNDEGVAPEVNIEDITLEQAKGYEYGSWKDEKFKGEGIPTLSDVLDFSEKNPNVPLKFDNVWTSFPDELRKAFLNEIAEREGKVNVGITCNTLESLEEVAKTLPWATLHYDGMDLSEYLLKTVLAIANKRELFIWVCYDLPDLSWFKGEKATPELCERVRKYGKLGIWIISTHEELETAVLNFKADLIETNGRVKPQWLRSLV